MSLSDELARPLPKVPHPFLPKRGLLEAEANRLSARFEGVAREVKPPRNWIAEVEAAIGEDGAGLERLGRRELKVMPYVIWGPDPKWRINQNFIRRFLILVAAIWPSATRRLWRHYVLNFDPKIAATQEVALWLQERVHQLPGPMRAFSETYAVLDVERAGQTLGAAALADERLIQDIEQLGLGINLVRSSALLLSIAEAAGRELAASARIYHPADKLTALMADRPRNAIAEAVGTDAAKGRALRSLVDGLVSWQEQQQGHDAAPERILEFVLSLNGDPKFARHRWEGHVADQSIACVERWLTRETIESFFRVMNTLKTDRPDMSKARRAFWMSYLPHISRAWLIAGSNAVPLAEKEGFRFGMLEGTVQADHCGLMLQIQNMNVLEMNKNGSAIFWTSGTKGLKGLYEKSYNRNMYLKRRDDKNVFVLIHSGNWQSRFQNRILQMTGIQPSR